MKARPEWRCGGYLELMGVLGALSSAQNMSLAAFAFRSCYYQNLPLGALWFPRPGAGLGLAHKEVPVALVRGRAVHGELVGLGHREARDDARGQLRGEEAGIQGAAGLKAQCAGGDE